MEKKYDLWLRNQFSLMNNCQKTKYIATHATPGHSLQKKIPCEHSSPNVSFFQGVSFNFYIGTEPTGQSIIQKLALARSLWSQMKKETGRKSKRKVSHGVSVVCHRRSPQTLNACSRFTNLGNSSLLPTSTTSGWFINRLSCRWVPLSRRRDIKQMPELLPEIN